MEWSQIKLQILKINEILWFCVLEGNTNVEVASSQSSIINLFYWILYRDVLLSGLKNKGNAVQ